MEDITKVRQPLQNFEAIYLLTPDEMVGLQTKMDESCNGMIIGFTQGSSYFEVA